MRRSGRASWPAQAAAFIAVALLTLAGSQSIIMQALDALPWAGWPVCSVGADKSDHHAPADKATHQVCSVCAAAACPPLGAQGPRVRAPFALAWSPWRPLSTLGPRGPPAFPPKARGPPPSLLTA